LVLNRKKGKYSKKLTTITLKRKTINNQAHYTTPVLLLRILQ